jgi:hypothetical protein
MIKKITKELFINSINLIEKQFEHDQKCSDAASIIFPSDFISGYDNHYLLDGLLSILKMTLNDNHKDSWIEYFIYELEFGKKYTSTSELRYGKLVFMTDADCIDGETLILTKEGKKKIKNITYDDQVLTHIGEYKNIKNIIESKKDKFIEISVRGEKIKLGEYHKIPIFRDGEMKIIFAKDMLNTDLILIKK